MLLRKATGPCARMQILKRLRFSRTSKGISQDCLNQIKCPKRCSPVDLHPVAEIFDELGVKYGTPCAIWLLWRWLMLAQGLVLCEGLQQLMVAVLGLGRELTRSAAFQHSLESGEDGPFP